MSVHSINTRIQHNLPRPTVNLSCFQKSTFCVCIQIFDGLQVSLMSLGNKKVQFKVAARRGLNTLSFYSVDDFFYVEGWFMMLGMQFLEFLCYNNSLCRTCLKYMYVYDLFHVLLSFWQIIKWNVSMYVLIYVFCVCVCVCEWVSVCEAVCMYVLMYVCMYC